LEKSVKYNVIGAGADTCSRAICNDGPDYPLFVTQKSFGERARYLAYCFHKKPNQVTVFERIHK